MAVLAMPAGILVNLSGQHNGVLTLLQGSQTDTCCERIENVMLKQTPARGAPQRGGPRIGLLLRALASTAHARSRRPHHIRLLSLARSAAHHHARCAAGQALRLWACMRAISALPGESFIAAHHYLVCFATPFVLQQKQVSNPLGRFSPQGTACR